MNIRAQVSSVFHLDKCIGCHTCSVTCKNIWTDRKGAEYMWWNNVETKPGTGYPTRWEDQEHYRGGWDGEKQPLQLRSGGKGKGLLNLFHNPDLPSMDDYYEPWTYRYQDLFQAGQGSDQPVARSVSMVTGQPMDPQSGPNWDDDLGGSSLYAANDPSLEGLTPDERQQLFATERMAFFYLPRRCNHCLNAACVAGCPSGAIYKRGEDGVVLINQEKCRGWRMCVSACPYKKTYYNWTAGKSEKCISCYPRLESGEMPGCYASCVGRIRYMGVLLYDAAGIAATAGLPPQELAAAQRELILNPHDPAVIAQARRDGIPFPLLEAARQSPVYRFVKEWGLALPLHPEFRTLPMLFYVPPLLPVLAKVEGGVADMAQASFSSLEKARLPLRYLANLFAGGNEQEVEAVYRRLIAVRLQRRADSVGDLSAGEVEQAAAIVAPQVAREIYRMSALSSIKERIVVPPMAREMAIEAHTDPHEHRGANGFGARLAPARRW
ncbi:nitrate reductase, beta subunit [Desulfurispirillum indicum S5]|uniref:Nitrate reductase, beta subunit n=1 Tax=Desulfurispirillum indicum (strain ATCC BAA-1389 / DSM 22839 / S5) TaxID=653733 RepID=E6W578_DESIS|nr:nitrate reductase subunit beta [Desulfurispirillum indicum]ADU67157.1 nitrate reductase, beta subunit [Desulfurispirillum indicum S5]